MIQVPLTPYPPRKETPLKHGIQVNSPLLYKHPAITYSNTQILSNSCILEFVEIFLLLT